MKKFKSSKDIATKISSLGKALSKALKGSSEPVVFGMGTDSFLFYADLVRCLQKDIHCEFLTSTVLESAECFSVKDREVVLLFGEAPEKKNLAQLKKVFKIAGATKVLTVSLVANKTAISDFTCFKISKPVAGFGIKAFTKDLLLLESF